MYSLYFALAAFTGLGDNDFFVASVPEACVMAGFLLFNLLLAAYILGTLSVRVCLPTRALLDWRAKGCTACLCCQTPRHVAAGTVTMLMVKGDKRMKQFRDRVTNLRAYGKLNDIPERLMKAMEAHTELHFHNEQASDEQVLAIYPQTIRRRVLRHLYMESVKNCYLFAGCNSKFLDLVLSLGRVEQFMPQEQVRHSFTSTSCCGWAAGPALLCAHSAVAWCVRAARAEQVIAEGDNVNEFMVLLEGSATNMTGGKMPSSKGKGDRKSKRALSTAAFKRARQKSQHGNAPTLASAAGSGRMSFDGRDGEEGKPPLLRCVQSALGEVLRPPPTP